MYKYICPIDLDFQTLTSGTVYYSIFNTGTQNLSINRMMIQTMSATGSGNTKCMLAFARAKGTTPTGGSVVNYTKMHTDNPSITISIRKADTGLTNTSVIDPYFMEVAVRTGSDGHVFVYDLDDYYGLVLTPTQGMVIIADGDVVSGASMHGSIEFSQN